MGKSYYCEYCDKRMKCNINVRKKHLDGLPHKIAKAKCMARCKDPHAILKEESTKTPCTRFLKYGDCKFDSFCHFSHFTKQQIEEIQNIIRKLNVRQNTIRKRLERRKAIQVPWIYPQKKIKNHHIPPSLIQIQVCQKEVPIIEWG